MHIHAGENQTAAPRFRMAFLLNLGFAVLEVVGGILTRSTAILADAVHDLGDSLSLAVSWWMERRSHRPGDQRFTFGYRRFSLLGGLISAAVLSAGAALVLSQAVPRIFSPGTPHGPGMTGLAALGILINGAAVWQMRRAAGFNARMVMWHLLEDVLGWAAVLAGGLVIWVWGLAWIDPLLSVLITLVVLRRVILELRRAMRVLLQGVPDGMDTRAMEKATRALPGVVQVHHFHLWSLDGEGLVLTAHLVLANEPDSQGIRELKEHARRLISQWPVVHSTLEIEYPDEPCRIDDAIP